MHFFSMPPFARRPSHGLRTIRVAVAGIAAAFAATAVFAPGDIASEPKTPVAALDIASGTEPGGPLGLVTLVPASAHEIFVIKDFPRVLAMSRETPFGRMMADSRFGATVKPLKKKLDRLGRGVAAAISGDPARPDLAWLKSALVAEVSTREEGKRREGRLTILRHSDSEMAERMLLGRPRPRGALVARKTENIAGFDVLRLDIHTERKESIKAAGEAKRYHKDSGLSKSVRRGGVTKAVRRSVTSERLYVGPRYAILATGDYQPIDEVLESLAKLKRSGGSPEGNTPPWVRPLLNEVDGDFLVFYRLDFAGSLGEGFGDLFGDNAEARALGMDDLKAAGIGLGLTREALELDVAIHAPSPRRGIGRLLFTGEPIEQNVDNQPISGRIRALIPADAASYTLMRVDGARWFREFLGLLKTGAPKLEALVRLYLEPPGMGSREGGVSNLGDVLGEWWVSFEMPPVPGSKKSGSSAFMIALKPKLEPKTVIGDWITAVGTLMNAEIEKTETPLGTQYRLGGGGGLMDGASPLGPLGSFYVTDEWLIFTDDPDALAATLATTPAETASGAVSPRERITNSLPEARFYEAVATGGPVGGDGFVESGPVVMALYRVTESFFNSLVDLGSAPAEDAWSTYFGPMSLGMEARGDYFRGSGILAYGRDWAASE